MTLLHGTDNPQPGAFKKHLNPCEAIKETTFKWNVLWYGKHDLDLGWNLTWNGSGDKSPEMDVGFNKKVSDTLSVKGRINHEGHIDAALRCDLNESWKFVASTGLESTAIGGKTEAKLGFGLEGKI